MSTDIKDVFVMTDRSGDDKSTWIRIGVAFVNKDQSLNVVLDAIPISGRLHIRDRRPLKKNNKKEKL